MIAVVGTFEEQGGAERALRDLRFLGVQNGQIDLLSPRIPVRQRPRVPTGDSEPPGMAQTIGAFLGGAVGLAGGFWLATMVVSFLLADATTVFALSSIAAAITGIAGTLAGWIVGRGVDRAVQSGLPKDELFLYKDALRQGKFVLVCLAGNETEAEEARRILKREGAESIDAAKRRWWLGLRSPEDERYEAPPSETGRDPFAQGFESALNPEFHGKPWDQVVYLLAERYRDWSTDAFRRGFDRGQLASRAHLQAHGNA